MHISSVSSWHATARALVATGLVVATGAGARASGQERARSVTLAAALAAAGRAPELRAATLRTAAASASVGASGGLPPTSLSIGTTSATARAIVTASVPLPVFGTLGANVRVARADVEVARAEQRTGAIDLRLRVTSAWIELAGAQERATLLASSAERGAALATVARRRFEEGDSPRTDAVSAAAAAARSAAAARAAGSGLAAASATLAGLLGWDPTQPLHADPGLAEPEPLGALATLVSRARTRPSVHLAEARSHFAGAQADEASRARWPELSLEGEADIADPTLPGTEVRGSLAISLPLFSGLGDAQRAAEIRHDAALADLDTERRTARAEVITAYRRWEAVAIEARALAAEVLPATREAASLSRRAYEEGEATLVSVLEAERSLAEVEMELVGARAAAALARAELERASGGRP